MRKNGKHSLVIYLFLGMLLCAFKVNGQSIWSTVSVNKSSVYVGEPVQVTITVYTSTWFTKGVDLGNIKVNGAYTIYFRPVSQSFLKNGKNYAGVQQIYNVFPYSEQDIIFPSLDIEVESPADGDYKGKLHKLKSQEKKIRVKPIPPTIDGTDWLVASNLSVNDHWIGNKNKVKVGDVLERVITRNAGRTVSELIPPIVWDSIQNVSEYPGRATVQNKKDKTSFSASRTESIRYLFEKPGKVTIPERVFAWYNPYRKQLYKKTLKAVEIEVEPNPNLGILESVRDSLNVQLVQQTSAEEAEDEPFTILGLSVKQFLGYLLMAIFILYVFVKVLKALWHSYQKKHRDYLKSEAYYFHLLIKAIQQKEEKKIINALYLWIDQLQLTYPCVAALNGDFKAIDYRELAKTLTIEEAKAMRKKYFNSNQEMDRGVWINP